MQVHSLYPLFQVANVARSAQFYERHFGFRRIFDSDWYVQLRAAADHPFEIALIDQHHDSIPAAFRGVTGNTILSLYVDDAAAQAERLVAEGVSIVQPLRDEPFGQRHVIVADQDGILIDIITPIEPDPAFVAG